MIYTVSVTSQDQMSLPAAIRRQLFQTHQALVSLEKGKVIVEPIPDLRSLRGSFKSSKKAKISDIHKAFESYLAKEAVNNS